MEINGKPIKRIEVNFKTDLPDVCQAHRDALYYRILDYIQGPLIYIFVIEIVEMKCGRSLDAYLLALSGVTLAMLALKSAMIAVFQIMNIWPYYREIDLIEEKKEEDRHAT